MRFIPSQEFALPEDAGALGLDTPLPPVIDLGSKIAEFGRGERDSPFLTQARPPLRLINRTPGRVMAARRSA